MSYCNPDNPFPDPVIEEEIEAKLAGKAHQVGLEGWDTASILTMDAMNKIVHGQKVKLPNLKATSSWGFSIQGVWESWDMFPDKHFVGGVVRMCCKLKSGQAIDPKGKKHDIAGTRVYITVTIKSEDTPAIKLTDKTADQSQPGTVHSLLLQDKEHNHIAAVTVDKIEPNTPPSVFTPPSPFKPLVETFFNETSTLDAFNPVFHSALLNEKAAHANFQWVKPTLLSYASITNAGGDGYFAALCKTNKQNPAWNKLTNQIDASVADAWPTGVNSIFAISAERFVEKFLLDGAARLFEHAKPGDFKIDGDQLIVTNKTMLKWGKFKLGDGTQVEPTIPPGGLTMRVVEDRLESQFTGVTWTHPLLIGSDIFALNFTQNVYLKIGKNSKGEPVLMTTNDYKGQKKKKEVPDVRKPIIVAKPDRTAVTADRWIQIVGMALSVIGIGSFAAGKWIISAGEAVETANSVTAWINSADDILNVAADGEEAMNAVSQADSDLNNLAAAAAFGKAGTTVRFLEQAPYMVRFGKLASLLGAIAYGFQAWNKIKIDNDREFDPDTIPSLTTFMDNVLGAEAWPGVKGAELKHVRLAQSLLLYFNRTM